MAPRPTRLVISSIAFKGIISLQIQHRAVVTEGLKVAMVFRNKEGYVITSSHAYVPKTFRAIEKALCALYEDASGERFTVRFSLEAGETTAWKTP
jgi:hypothetical protein